MPDTNLTTPKREVDDELVLCLTEHQFVTIKCYSTFLVFIKDITPTGIWGMYKNNNQIVMGLWHWTDIISIKPSRKLSLK